MCKLGNARLYLFPVSMDTL